jgi:hypothetical protein
LRSGFDRVGRRLRLYPKEWRNRYGEEFAALLTSDLSERPRSLARDLDLLRSALLAHLSIVGLREQAGTLADPKRAQTSLASAGCALAVFTAFGLAVWAQLSVDWQWSSPEKTATFAAMFLMTGSLAVLCLITLIAALPIAWSVVVDLAKRRNPRIVAPVTLLAISLVLLVAGTRHFANAWPGTGGSHWAMQGLVPGGIAAFGWSASLSVTSYWAHPGSLLGFPPLELLWMATSPTLMVGLLVGSVKTFRRVEIAPAVLRFESRLARAVSYAMVFFVCGAACWILEGHSRSSALFRTGGIDLAALLVMAAAIFSTNRAAKVASAAVSISPA